jgi:NADH:ubiquinone oxidoreductase subunit 5 (subunit L)/multisubunit Na+/H+ antiporter MnhA subunit
MNLPNGLQKIASSPLVVVLIVIIILTLVALFIAPFLSNLFSKMFPNKPNFLARHPRRVSAASVIILIIVISIFGAFYYSNYSKKTSPNTVAVVHQLPTPKAYTKSSFNGTVTEINYQEKTLSVEHPFDKKVYKVVVSEGAVLLGVDGTTKIQFEQIKKGDKVVLSSNKTEKLEENATYIADWVGLY